MLLKAKHVEKPLLFKDLVGQLFQDGHFHKVPAGGSHMAVAEGTITDLTAKHNVSPLVVEAAATLEGEEVEETWEAAEVLEDLRIVATNSPLSSAPANQVSEDGLMFGKPGRVNLLRTLVAVEVE